MKSTKFLIPILFAFVTFASDSVAAPKPKPGTLMIEGELTGTFTISPINVIVPGEFTIVMTVSGELSNLGRVNAIAVGKSAVAEDLSVTPIPPTTVVLVTDSGDTLTARLRWEGEQTEVAGDYELMGVGEIIGGTGRFAKAKGTGTGLSTLSLTTREATLTISGSLSGVKKSAKK